MSEDWLKHINRAMSDYEVETDDSLWHEIEIKLSENQHKKIEWRKSVLFIVSGIAALTAIILSISFLAYRHDVSPVVNNSQTTLSDLQVLPQFKTEPVCYKANSMHNYKVNNNFALRETIVPDSIKTFDISVSKELPDTPTIVMRDTVAHTPVRSSTASSFYADGSNSDFIKLSRHKKSNFAIAMLASGSSGAAVSSTVLADQTSNSGSLGSNSVSWYDRPSLAIDVFNRGLDTKASIHHRQPIRAGIMVSYRTSQRAAVESGIIYTSLISDVKYGSEQHYYSGTQRLHYIGIPIHLNLKIASWNNVEFYSNAGFTAAKCISGKTKTSYYIDEKHLSTKTESTRPHQIQWSIEANAGAQYNITDAIGLFVEPGIGYYFKNGSKVRTIYKDQPLNFNLNMGLRFSIN